MKIEAGKTYVNGWGSLVPIVTAPSDACRYFKSDLGHGYFETGEMMTLGGTEHYNLLREANESDWLKNKTAETSH